MRRLWMVLLLAASGLAAGKPDQAPKRVLEFELTPGARTIGFNRVTYKVRTTIRVGLKVETTSESVQRTERFLDRVMRAGAGVFEIKRTYNMAQVKIQSDKDKRKTLEWSPMNGRTVRILERSRKREVRLEGSGVVDAFTRRTVGIELDWRDIFLDKPVGPGDEWDAETDALGRRMAAYLNAGEKSTMRVRYEENVTRDGRELAKLYVDWVLEGMRDRHLFTKVVLAGDLYYDFARKRVTGIDLGGSISINGIVMDHNKPRIIKGVGPLTLEGGIKDAPAVEAAAEGAKEPAK